MILRGPNKDDAPSTIPDEIVLSPKCDKIFRLIVAFATTSPDSNLKSPLEKSKKKNVGYTDVALQLAYNLVVGNDSAGVLYEPARMLGGILIPENDDRSPKDPKASNSLAIDWNISEGQSVKQSKLANAVLSAMPVPKQSSTSTKNREN